MNFNEYIEYAKKESPELTSEIDDAIFSADIIAAVIKRRAELGITQRDLARICNMPQSSIARIETMKVSPSLDTLMKVLRPLGMKLTISST